MNNKFIGVIYKYTSPKIAIWNENNSRKYKSCYIPTLEELKSLPKGKDSK